MFDFDAVLNSVSTEANATQLDPVPNGKYKAVSQEVNRESFSDFKYSKGEKAGQTGYAMTVWWKIDDESAGENNGRKVPQRLNIDLTADGRGLAGGKGKNIELGRLREALGQNRDGQNWAPSMLGHQVAMIDVEQEPDKNDSSKIYSKVKGVTALT